MYVHTCIKSPKSEDESFEFSSFQGSLSSSCDVRGGCARDQGVRDEGDKALPLWGSKTCERASRRQLQLTSHGKCQHGERRRVPPGSGGWAGGGIWAGIPVEEMPELKYEG